MTTNEHILIRSIRTQGAQVCLVAGVGLKPWIHEQSSHLARGAQVSVIPIQTLKQILGVTVCEPAWKKSLINSMVSA